MSLAADIAERREIYGYGTRYQDSDAKLYKFYRPDAATNWTVSALSPPYSGSAPAVRANPVMARWNDKLVMFGGLNITTGGPVNDPM